MGDTADLSRETQRTGQTVDQLAVRREMAEPLKQIAELQGATAWLLGRTRADPEPLTEDFGQRFSLLQRRGQHAAE